MRTKRPLAIVLTMLLLLSALPMIISAAPMEDSTDTVNIQPITDFPEPESFTTRLDTIPNPFISWEGSKVTPATWPARSAQLKQIMEHYETGYMPSTDGITVSLAVTKAQSNYTSASGAGTAQVTVYKDGVAAPTKINISFFLPNPATKTPPANGYPVVFNTSTSVSGFMNLANEYGIATVGINVANIDSGDNETGSYKGNNRAGVVNDIFNILAMMPDASRTAYSAGLIDGRYQPPYIKDPGNPDAPSLMISQTWGISRVLDALQADNAKPANERLINVDPLKSAITGMSRLGKLALVAGAFEPRFAVVNPVSSGSGGIVLDRSTSVAVNEKQSLGLEPSMGGAYPINKYYYYVKIQDKGLWDSTWRADSVLPAEALVDPNGRLDGGTTATSAYQNFNNFNDFIQGLKVAEGSLNPYATGANANAKTGVGHGDNIKPGYAVINFGIQTGAGVEQGWHQGTQNFTDVRWGYGAWFTPRFREFQVQPELYNVDIIKRANRGEYGQLSTEPFDQNFLAAIIAPRALLIQDGYLSNNTNPEGTYLGYLADREVYRFLGIPEKIGLNMHLINHANPLREQMELGEFMTSIFNNQTPDPKFRIQPFPINDPRSLYDYKKLDWAAPGYISIKDQVEALGLTETDKPSVSIYADNFLSVPINVTTNANLIKKGDYFDVKASFLKTITTNAVNITVNYDSSKFEYAGNLGADPSQDSYIEGVTCLNSQTTGAGASFILMIQDYNALDLVSLRFRAKEDIDIQNADYSISANADFIYKEDNYKYMMHGFGSTDFSTVGVPGDTDSDGNVTLMDLSNVIDMFGVKKGDVLWAKAKFYDFNKNSIIDISDIVSVAKLII